MCDKLFHVWFGHLPFDFVMIAISYEVSFCQHCILSNGGGLLLLNLRVASRLLMRVLTRRTCNVTIDANDST